MTRDLGRMLQVSQGLSHVLTTNPSLWRVVDLEDDYRVKSPFTAVKVFASRSRDTLEVVRVSCLEFARNQEKSEEFYSLLERSKASLRMVDFALADPHSQSAQSVFKTISAYPKLEHISFGFGFPRAVKDQLSGGKLELLGLEVLSGLESWSSVELSRFSSLKALCVHDYHSEDGSLQILLQVCKSSLTYFSLEYFDSSDDTEDLLDDDFPNLESLSFYTQGDLSSITSQPLPKLKFLKGGARLLSSCPHFKDVESIHFITEDTTSLYEDGESDQEIIHCMVRLCSWSNSTLKRIELETGVFDNPCCIDNFFRALQVTFFEILCPLLSEVYVGRSLGYDDSILAETMVSRNFAANRGRVEGEEMECSRVTIYFFDDSDLENFQAKEDDVLSMCSESFQERAGISEVRKWEV